MRKFITTLLMCSFVLYGCGGGGGGGSVDSGDSGVKAGVVVDPYLEGAVFCIDQNKNDACDDDEPVSSESDADGNFEFDVPLEAGDIILMKEAGFHNGDPYEYGKMKADFDGDDLLVSPLTTLLSKGLSRKQIVDMLDPDGTLGLTEDMVDQDPVKALETADGDVTEASIALTRASVGAYMMLRLVETNEDLASLSGEELANNADIKTIASSMVGIVKEAISVDVVKGFQSQLDQQGGGALPDVEIMDVVFTAVKVCEEVVRKAEEAYAENEGDVSATFTSVKQFTDTSMDDMITVYSHQAYTDRLEKEGNELTEVVKETLGVKEKLDCEFGEEFVNGALQCYVPPVVKPTVIKVSMEKALDAIFGDDTIFSRDELFGLMIILERADRPKMLNFFTEMSSAASTMTIAEIISAAMDAESGLLPDEGDVDEDYMDLVKAMLRAADLNDDISYGLMMLYTDLTAAKLTKLVTLFKATVREPAFAAKVVADIREAIEEADGDLEDAFAYLMGEELEKGKPMEEIMDYIFGGESPFSEEQVKALMLILWQADSEEVQTFYNLMEAHGDEFTPQDLRDAATDVANGADVSDETDEYQDLVAALAAISQLDQLVGNALMTLFPAIDQTKMDILGDLFTAMADENAFSDVADMVQQAMTEADNDPDDAYSILMGEELVEMSFAELMDEIFSGESMLTGEEMQALMTLLWKVDDEAIQTLLGDLAAVYGVLPVEDIQAAAAEASGGDVRADADRTEEYNKLVISFTAAYDVDQDVKAAIEYLISNLTEEMLDMLDELLEAMQTEDVFAALADQIDQLITAANGDIDVAFANFMGDSSEGDDPVSDALDDIFGDESIFSEDEMKAMLVMIEEGDTDEMLALFGSFVASEGVLTIEQMQGAAGDAATGATAETDEAYLALYNAIGGAAGLNDYMPDSLGFIFTGLTAEKLGYINNLINTLEQEEMLGEIVTQVKAAFVEANGDIDLVLQILNSDEEPSAERTIADSPVILGDIDSEEFGGDASAATGRAVPSTYTPGACYTYGMRYNASYFIPKAEYFRCTLATMVDQGGIPLNDTGLTYVKIAHDGMDHLVKLTYDDTSAQADICYANLPGNSPVADHQNVRVNFSNTPEGVEVKAVYLIHEDDHDTLVAAGAKVTDETEAYKFVVHFVNEQDENCAGPSGASLTEEDDQCYLRYEGKIEYDLPVVDGRADPTYSFDSDTYSRFKGGFTEKLYNHDDPDTADVDESSFVLAGGMFATFVADGVGYTKYKHNTSAEDYVWSAASSETWISSTLMQVLENYLDDYFGGEAVPERTVEIPAIVDPWDCQADSFVELEMDAYDMSACNESNYALPAFAGAADMTTCSEGSDSENLLETLENYRCQDGDPMTLGASGCTPE